MAIANRYAGSQPDTYHQYRVPLIFAEYAEVTAPMQAIVFHAL